MLCWALGEYLYNHEGGMGEEDILKVIECLEEQIEKKKGFFVRVRREEKEEGVMGVESMFVCVQLIRVQRAF